MRHLSLVLLGAIIAVPSVTTAQSRQSDRGGFTLSERLAAGQWIRVRNLNGEVRVRSSSGDKVEVVGTKSWRRGDPKDVTIETKRSGDGSILVCAIWAGTNAVCSEDRYSTHSEGRSRWDRGRDDDRNDVSVAFEIRVPKGVKVGAWTVNGEVSVDGATSEVQAGTVNGGVQATSLGGPVQASTVNGSVRALMGRFDGDQDLSFSTVNGSVIAAFAGDMNAEIELTTVNGEFQSDWPMTISGRLDPHHLRATLGKGGRRIKLTTVNGNVELRKR